MDVTGKWTFHSRHGDEELHVDYPTRTGGWNCRFLDRSEGSLAVIGQTIPAADLAAWIEQGVITR